MARKISAGESDPASDFATTHWSLVLNAGRGSSPQARTALATLCETYWYPLYALVRRQGHDSAEAQDLTQSFFTSLLQKRDLQKVRPERGRFRTFLAVALKHFLINEWRRGRAIKRGGGRIALSLDFAEGESRYRAARTDANTPEACFVRQWALTLLQRVQDVLRNEYAQAGKGERFARLQSFLTGEESTRAFAELACELNVSETAVRVAVHRLRRRFRDLLRAEIAQTVLHEAEIDDEIRALFEALRA